MLVTHPEATHHVDRLVGGWYDTDLTARGLAQAELIAAEVADRLPGGSEVSVVSSDLVRTRRTAEVVAARLGMTVVLDPDLREMSYGVAGGRPPGTFAVLPPPTGPGTSSLDRLRHHDGVEGSESRLDAATRAYAGVRRVMADSAEHVVVVTHGGVATFVVTAWLGLPVETVGDVRLRFGSGSIIELRRDPASRRIETLASVGHLAAGA